LEEVEWIREEEEEGNGRGRKELSSREPLHAYKVFF
jgi:hypothetical protein